MICRLEGVDIAAADEPMELGGQSRILQNTYGLVTIIVIDLPVVREHLWNLDHLEHGSVTRTPLGSTLLKEGNTVGVAADPVI
jgi:hypothetical protein